MFIAGLYLTDSFVAKFVGAGYAMVPDETVANHRAVFGLFIIIAAFQIFTAMLPMHGVAGFAPLPDRRDAGEIGRVEVEHCNAGDVVA
jgi:hypothetical protein